MSAEEHCPTEERLAELLVGRSVTMTRVVEESPEPYTAGPTGYLTLDDGKVLKVWGNDGGCACSAGCYPLSELHTVPNVITNVELDEDPAGDDRPCRSCGSTSWQCDCRYDEKNYYEGHYRIFVFAEDRRHMLASFDGTDGNGYYGSGWWLQVQDASA